MDHCRESAARLVSDGGDGDGGGDGGSVGKSGGGDAAGV
jgi:hypothetical protein